MGPMSVVLLILAAAVAFMVGRMVRPDKTVQPKPLGLEAFESHGLGRASNVEGRGNESPPTPPFLLHKIHLPQTIDFLIKNVNILTR